MQSNQNAFYKTSKWTRKRDQVLRRDGWRCQVSKRYSFLPVVAETVHHVLPLEDFPEYALEGWNLLSVSNKVHNQLHDRNTGELTELGLEVAERVLLRHRPELMWYVEERRSRKKEKERRKNVPKYYDGPR